MKMSVPPMKECVSLIIVTFELQKVFLVLFMFVCDMPCALLRCRSATEGGIPEVENSTFQINLGFVILYRRRNSHATVDGCLR